MVSAAQSEAVERALVRILEGPAVEEAMQRLLASPAVERVLLEALDSDMVDRVWERLLASDEAQRLVERIAEAPEVRAAVAAQGVGLLDDMGFQAREVTRRLDDWVERLARAVVFRRRRTEPTRTAGFVTRLVGLTIDLAVVSAGLFVVSGLLAIALSLVFPGSDGSTSALLAGTAAWLLAGAGYLLSFWSLSGQTLGMRFLSIRLDVDGSRRVGLRCALRRLIGGVLAAIPLGAGFLGILYSERRHGLQDWFAGTDVIFVDQPGREAPHSVAPADGEPTPRSATPPA